MTFKGIGQRMRTIPMSTSSVRGWWDVELYELAILAGAV
jgi:hypothetical protein